MHKSPRYLYIMEGGGFHKIGIAFDPERRVKDLNLPFDVTVIHSIRLAAPDIAERILHGCFGHKRVRGEWFRLDPIDIFLIRRLQTPQDFFNIAHQTERFVLYLDQGVWYFSYDEVALLRNPAS